MDCNIFETLCQILYFKAEFCCCFSPFCSYIKDTFSVIKNCGSCFAFHAPAILNSTFCCGVSFSSLFLFHLINEADHFFIVRFDLGKSFLNSFGSAVAGNLHENLCVFKQGFQSQVGSHPF